MSHLSFNFRSLAVVICLALLSGCASRDSNSAPGKVSVRVELSPTLEYLTPAIQACTLQSGRLDIILEEKPASEMGKTDADVSFLWGDRKVPAGMQTYRLGADRLVFAANTENPIERLTVEQTFLLYRAGLETWDEALNDFCPGCETGETFAGRNIEAWHYTGGSDIFAEISSLSADYPADTIHRTFIAPSPSSLMEAMNNNPAAIGWLPARWLNNSIKEIIVDGLNPYSQIIPVVAALPHQPDPLMEEWLQCLQSSYGN